ncbi:glutamyl-tRNA reductase [Aureitalea marina]|uniref:Glutamyl-tRNA reductase n=1 Tax=Aureitalea marina TaxID=930804 RepID=A0A2S7KSE1_9FLAO|nr:glutamyl-tRNA reductase [Aureitalea marina]PQB05544.1 glutamyl-tRNA reductase [Aureitalea marina]
MRENNASSTTALNSGAKFYVIGLSYIKADAEIRGHFSLDREGCDRLIDTAKEQGIPSLSVISTCNRTELYGFADHPYQLIKLLCEQTKGTLEEFEQVAYILKGDEAINHLFRVATGLESQILGDFEIISQLKTSFRHSKNRGMLNAYMERLANALIQASKRIKNETELSSGATSVSYAAVQYIKDNVQDVGEKNILLFGTGKIGRNTCENLVKHTHNDHIVLINRTKERAQEIAGKFNLQVRDYNQIESEIARTDVMVVATGAQTPTASAEILHLTKPLLILDLSIPRNVDINVQQNPLVTLVHLDELSKATQSTLEKRSAHIPMAEEIIEEVKTEFSAWSETRKFAPVLKALKSKLADIKTGEIDNQSRKIEGFNQEQAQIISDRLIHKITTQVANHLKNANGSTQISLEVIRQVFQLEEEH